MPATENTITPHDPGLSAPAVLDRRLQEVQTPHDHETVFTLAPDEPAVVPSCIGDLYVLLWSHLQRAWHIETIGEMLRHNVDILARDATTDWIMVGICMNHKQASDLSESLEKHQELPAMKALKEKWERVWSGDILGA